jgi:hypothetical protein
MHLEIAFACLDIGLNTDSERKEVKHSMQSQVAPSAGTGIRDAEGNESADLDPEDELEMLLEEAYEGFEEMMAEVRSLML